MSTPNERLSQTSDRTLLSRLRRGEESAATALYLRYARRLLALTQARTSNELAAKEEADDIVQSVFKSFFRKASAGLYDVPEGEELWNLLLVITINKIRAKGNYHRAAKRDMRLAAGEQSLEAVASEHADNDTALTELRMVIDEILKGMPEKSVEIVELRIAGHEVNDIVARARRSKRTVERVLQDFRERLRQDRRGQRMTAQPTTEFGPVEAFVNAYESVRAREEVPIRQFLPPRDDPRFVPALAELIRVEMEYAWADGRPRRLADYREEYPELFTDPLALAAVAFEEYRLRRHAAEPVSRDEYVRNFGVDTSTWPDEFESVQELSQRLAETEALFPDVGQTIAGFRLERELGRGAFGRVYLARQGDLADRPVALKIAADVGVESRVLARLQHTNVMPVYSVHRSGPFQAVCMPFFPAVTLADLCRSLSKRETVPDSGRALLDTLRARTALAGQNLSSDPSAPELAPPPVKANLDLLAGVSFVKAVVWLGARLADGLAHAHDRGIVHRDLKPANVLLTDEGQPLILDFNLAADMNPSAEQARAALGGTLPYMPPEHLQAFRDRKPYRDPRGDVYALGLILYELLAARHPFPVRRGDPDRSLAQMIADRERAPDVRPFNRSVPRGLEAILCKCLEADPSKRYPTARELAEDLQRQFDDQPLLHAREPLREQFGKWRRRHPRLTSWFTVGGIAAALLLAGALTVRGLMQRNETLETRDLATRFHADFEDTHFRAAFPVPIDATPPDAAGQMTAFRERWERVLTANLAEPPWTEALPPDELARLRREVGDSYYLLVEELIHRPDAHSPDTWREALELNGRGAVRIPG